MLARLGRGLRDAWLLLGITAALLVAAEWLAGRWVTPRVAADVGAERAAADTYAGADWVQAYFEEFARANRTEWHPYVYWRRKPFQGRFINIDGGGVRRTWTSPAAGDAPRRVFLLGGSVMWGTGARDDHTIASEVARALGQRGVGDVQVINFGEGGYVSMQELILLEDEVRRGNRPEAVIFLDGVNDLFAAYQSGVAGIPQNEANRAREFNIDVDGRIYREAFGVFVRNLALFQVLAPPPAGEAAKQNGELPALGENAVRVYLATVEAADRLAHAYGFPAVFYWQPTVFTKARPSAYEQRMAAQPAVPRAFYERSYALAREAFAGSAVRDLSGVFGDDPQPVYIDFCHLGEKGNEKIGAVMAADLDQALAGRPAGREPGDAGAPAAAQP